jgi:hypothetical protein
MLKGGFVIGVRHGRGVVVAREPNGGWRAPLFISVTGGSIGWQIGVQSTDLILVFRTKKSVDNLMHGKFTIGADAAAAAGPVGREVSAATDAQLKAEILSYSRSRGLFAGISLDGSAISVDDDANAAYYSPVGSEGGSAIPPSAMKLVSTIVAYARPESVEAVPDAPVELQLPPATGQPTPAAADVEGVRQTVARASQQLGGLLTPDWQRYLALPAEIYTPQAPLDPQSLAAVLARFDSVAQNPQYRALSQRPEFRATHGSLRQLVETVAQGNPPLTLPPPPAIPQ